MKKTCLLVGAILLVAFTTSVQAVSINGSIAFNGTATFNSTPISGATSFTSLSPGFTAFGQQTGDYSSVPNFYSASFTPFTFSPTAASVTPLWSFTYSGDLYEFNATSMTSSFDAVRNIWNIGGAGTASITGFTPTTGTWNLSAGNQGASFFFGSAAVVSGVPDGGMTLAMLGLALSGLGLMRRKLVD